MGIIEMSVDRLEELTEDIIGLRQLLEEVPLKGRIVLKETKNNGATKWCIYTEIDENIQIANTFRELVDLVVGEINEEYEQSVLFTHVGSVETIEEEEDFEDFEEFEETLEEIQIMEDFEEVDALV